MKGKNWRDFEPEREQRMAEARQRRKKRKRKGGLVKKLKLAVILFIFGYAGFMVYYTLSKPYTIALDAGHGGWDVGAEGIIQEVELTERTVAELEALLKEDGRFRMNPPIRSEEDRLALVQGIQDGTIDMIATDHAPHSAEEKSKGLSGSAFGIVGIETAFSAMYTHMVLPGIITLEKLVQLLTVNPRTRFGIPVGEDFTVWNLEKEFTVDHAQFLSMGKATPFTGWKLKGECVLTVCDGKVVYRK